MRSVLLSSVVVVFLPRIDDQENDVCLVSHSLLIQSSVDEYGKFTVVNSQALKSIWLMFQ